ncbi:MAG: NUDIX domain-containing protein [Anaerolineae bacterium]|nr:NUDIX domain-containing protein [Anaerolineae bacterium]
MGKQDQGIAVSRGRDHVVPRTLSFITHGEDVLLLRGAPDKRIWPNRYNGVGGHVERDEDVLTAAVREMQEETGLQVRNVRLRGVIHIDAGEAQTGILLFVFTAQAMERQLSPSREGTLEWVPRERLSSLDLVEDLPLILPRVLSMAADEPPFFAHYDYDEDDALIVTFACHSTG